MSKNKKTFTAKTRKVGNSWGILIPRTYFEQEILQKNKVHKFKIIKEEVVQDE